MYGLSVFTYQAPPALVVLDPPLLNNMFLDITTNTCGPNSVPTVLGFTACFCPSMHQLDNEQNKDF